MGITIIGAGHMARGIGTRLVAAGEPITIMDRTPERAEALARELQEHARSGATVSTAALGDPIKDNTVVLALFYPIEKELIPQLQQQLSGKTIVEISNPLNETFDDLATPEGLSAAEEIARMIPGAKVVKAFNTTFAGTLEKGQVAGVRLDVFLASDDLDAKTHLGAILASGGLRPLDVGPLKRARQLEGLGLLHIAEQFTLNTNYGSAVKIIS